MLVDGMVTMEAETAAASGAVLFKVVMVEVLSEVLTVSGVVVTAYFVGIGAVLSLVVVDVVGVKCCGGGRVVRESVLFEELEK